MAFEEVGFSTDMHKFVKDEPVEGVLESVKEDVGPNNSKVYKVSGISFWGTRALDVLLSDVPVGTKVRITLVDENFKFPNGRFGKNFKVEVDRE